MQTHKILHMPRPDTQAQKNLCQNLKISAILAQLLLNRGIRSADEAEKFLNTSLQHLLDPYAFSDMRKAVRLTKKHIQKKDKIMLCGDYDADGLTAIAVLTNTLRSMGADVIHYVPHRIHEGYGLHDRVIELAKQKKVKLVITADCGTNECEHISSLRKLRIEVIITDHHEPTLSQLPAASAHLNPKLKNSNYSYKDLAGVGVAYKLCQALSAELLTEELDLVSLGTIADVVPLTGENRILVKEGLTRITETKRLGLRKLMEVSGIRDRKITTQFVSYIIGPRINASGRMDTAESALHLLLSDSEEEAIRLAEKLQEQNRQRQKVESKILEEAEAIIAREINFKEHKVIVVAKEAWHEGVLGIVAAKLAERFYRPTIVISLKANLCKGSGRSIKNFHLFQALSSCHDLLHEFGGHSHAVGLLIKKDSIVTFRNRINRLAAEQLRLEDLLPGIEVDMELSLADLSEDVVRELLKLEPFGTDNPKPLFFTRNLTLKAKPLLLGKNTLKCWVSDGSRTYPAIGFGMGDYKESLLSKSSFDLVYTPVVDAWQADSTVLLEIEEIIFK